MRDIARTCTHSDTWSGKTSGRKDRLWGQMGVNRMPGTWAGETRDRGGGGAGRKGMRDKVIRLLDRSCRIGAPTPFARRLVAYCICWFPSPHLRVHHGAPRRQVVGSAAGGGGHNQTVALQGGRHSDSTACYCNLPV